MQLLWQHRVSSFIAILCIVLFWAITGFSMDSLPFVVLGSIACAMMYFQTIARLRYIDNQNRLLDQIVQNIPGAIFWKDAHSRYLGCNGYFAKFAGCDSPSELIGKTDLELKWRKKDAQLYHLSDLEVIHTQRPVVNSEIMYRAAEGYIALLENKVPLLDQKGNSSGILGMFQDVTAQKELKLALENAKKLESLGQLSAGIAHEINTPMQAITLNISFIKDSYERLSRVVDSMLQSLESLPSETRHALLASMKTNNFEFCRHQVPEAIEEANEASGRVTEVISAMMYMAHPSSNQRHRVDINTLVSNAVTLSRSTWKGAATVDLHFEEGLPEVSALQSALTQVLLNLIVNSCHSIEAVRRSDGRISLSTSLQDDGVRIDVRDNGVGISKSNLSRVFDPFFTTKEVGKGTGQGLAISYDIIVNRHSGRISVTSEENAGTTFSIWLPGAVHANEPDEVQEELAFSGA
jgi:PAS domain S-box-containing protein